MMKGIASVLLTWALLITLFPLSCFAADKQLYCGVHSIHDTLYLDAGIYENGHKFYTSQVSESEFYTKNIDDPGNFTFPAFLIVTENAGGQYGIDTSNAKPGDRGTITYTDKTGTYSMNVVINGSNGGNTSSERRPGNGQGKLYVCRYSLQEIFNIETGQVQQGVRFYTEKVTKEELDTQWIDGSEGFSFPSFITPQYQGSGYWTFDTTNVQWGQSGYITFKEDGHEYKIRLYISENKAQAKKALLLAQGIEVGTFLDVSKDKYFYDAVEWANANQITTGTGKGNFSPYDTCTRGQVLTFLWRAMGCPRAGEDVEFSDVKSDAYYYDAVKWGVAMGITNGVSADRFAPDETCSNASILTFIHRALNGGMNTQTSEVWYEEALFWAKAGGLIDGTYTGNFDVNQNCSRANTAVYLYRELRDKT